MSIFESDRRGFLRLMGLGGVVFASGLPGARAAFGGTKTNGGVEDFFFVQLSDTHWGFSGAAQPRGRRTR